MKNQLLISICALLGVSLSSCVSSTVVAAAAGAKAIGEASASISENVTGLFGCDKAPESLAEKIVTLTGTLTTADNSNNTIRDTLAFSSDGETTRTINGHTQTLTYARLGENKGCITLSIMGEATETYTLIFTQKNSGTFTYERQSTQGTTSGGEGSFSIK